MPSLVVIYLIIPAPLHWLGSKIFIITFYDAHIYNSFTEKAPGANEVCVGKDTGKSKKYKQRGQQNRNLGGKQGIPFSSAPACDTQ